MKPAFTLVMLALVTTCFSQTFRIDPNFYCNGKAAIRTGGGISSAMAVQADGKILIGGRGGETIYNSGLCLVRFNANGTIDSSFGVNGKVITVYGGGIQSIVVLPDGKILTGGYFGTVILARYLPNGTLDSSFGTNGIFQPQFPGIKYSFCYTMKVQPDKKIVIAGNVNGTNAFVARFLPDGGFDTEFAQVGYTFVASASIAFDMAIQPDNKIIIAGQGLAWNNFMLARFLSDGTLDTQFGNTGVVLTDMTSMSEFLNSIALQNDGKIVVTGRYDYNNQYANNFKTAILRYNTDGTLDNNFGNNGITNLQFQDASADPKKIMIQSDGKILIAGDYTDVYSFHKPSLARFNNDGTADNSFGDNGTLISAQFGDSLSCKSAALLPDGKIVLGGYQMVQLDTTITYYTDSFVVVRYQSNALLPITYLNFSGQKQQQSVLLNWQTANELNNNYFSLERSASNSFSELAKISTNKSHNYSYTDFKPLSGTNYYRLKEVDNDGKTTYSQIVSIVFDGTNKFIVYPNPVTSVLNVQGLKPAETYQLILTDAKGSVVDKKAVGNMSAYSWSVSNLAKGFYNLKIISNNNYSSSIKVIKE